MFALNASNCRRLRTTKLSAWHKTAAILSAAVAGVLGLTGHAQQANADLNWDPSGVTPTGSDGPGTWNLSLPEWGNGGSDSPWTNGNTGAIFGIGGTGGAVTLGTNIVSGNLTFNSSGYSITGNLANDGILTFAGTNNNIITTNFNATINGPLVGSTGFTKNGTGTLTFGSGALQYFNGGVITINAGSVVLNATNDNFLSYVASNVSGADTVANAPILNLGTNAVTLDLNGASPIFGRVLNQTSGVQVASSAGIVTNSNTNVLSTFTVTATNAAFTDFFSGTITGNVALTYAPAANSNSWTLASAQTYTGPTTIQSGTMVLGGGSIGFNGQIQNSAGIINYASLTLDNTNGNVNNRIAPTVPLTMYGSSLTLNGNSAVTSSQTLNSVTLDSGLSTVTINPVVGGGTSSLTLGNLISGTHGADVVFSAGTNLGSTLSANPANVIINQINGTTSATILTNNNNLIGSWAYAVNGTNVNFATLNSSNIVGAMGDTADGFTDYTHVTSLASTTTSANYLYTGSTSGLPDNSNTTTINSLNVSGAVASFSLGFGNHVLLLGSGGLIVNSTGAFAPASGNFSAGAGAGYDLNIYMRSSTTQWQADIINDGTNAVSLVKNGPGTLEVVGAYVASGAFGYTGSTIVNQGTLELDSPVTAGNYTLGSGQAIVNNGGTLQVAASNQLNPSSTLTINGGGVFLDSFTNYTNRISTLILNDQGGTLEPLVKLIGAGAPGAATLIVTSEILATNNDPTQVPLIYNPSNSDGALDLGGGNVTFDMEGTAPVSLQIGSGSAEGFIQNGSITKTGPDMLVLNLGIGGTAYSGMTINQGAVRLDANSAGSQYDLPAGATATVNTGGTLIFNDSAGNGPQQFAGNVTLSGGTLGLVCNSDILYGNVTISSSGGTINLDDYYNPTVGRTVIFSGTGGGSLQGAGSLTLIGATIPTNTASLTLTGNANSFSGAITITTHATLVSQAQQGYGNTFGTNTITFNNGYLLIADNGGSGTGVANTPLSGYNNNLVLNGPGTITMGGSTGSSSNTTGNTVPFNNVALYNNTTLTANVYNQYSIGIYGLRIGGTLSGGGTLGGTVPITVTGAVVPGDQPAILNITNTKFSFSGGTNATYSPEINRNLGAGWQGGSTTNAGISYDQINMVAGTGLVMNGAMLNVRMTGGTNSIAAGDEFFLVNQTVAAASGSSFATVVDFTENSITTPETSIGTDPTDNALEYSDPTNPNIEYEVDYVGNIANGALTGGNDVVLDVVSVPEPSVLGLLALGGMGLLARRRRRTTQRN